MSSAATASCRKMKRRWKIWRVTLFGRLSHRSACGIWNRKERFSRRAAAGIEKTGDDFPAQGFQDAPEKGQDHGRDGADAFLMETFRFQCLLRQPDIAER